MLIPDDLIEKYKIETFKDEPIPDGLIYRQFLERTDYICNKIVEGVSTKVDYEYELYYRNIARQEIDKILNTNNEQ